MTDGRVTAHGHGLTGQQGRQGRRRQSGREVCPAPGRYLLWLSAEHSMLLNGAKSVARTMVSIKHYIVVSTMMD